MAPQKTNAMRGINLYGQELSNEEIAQKRHRSFIGGMWEELGILQFDFLVSQGLRRSHKLLDLGCGCLRGGLHFIAYLETGHYYGLDVNQSLIDAGKSEISQSGLTQQNPRLMVDDQFRVNRFNLNFDFIISVSLFTHLPINSIVRCLKEVSKCLDNDGIYFSTFFEASCSSCLEEIHHHPGGTISSYDRDPFHYSFDEVSWMAHVSGLRAEYIGDWNHPRDQKMVAFTLH